MNVAALKQHRGCEMLPSSGATWQNQTDEYRGLIMSPSRARTRTHDGLSPLDKKYCVMLRKKLLEIEPPQGSFLVAATWSPVPSALEVSGCSRGRRGTRWTRQRPAQTKLVLSASEDVKLDVKCPRLVF